MSQAFRDALGFCKTIMRNGYDAYIINTRLQRQTLDSDTADTEVDIATEMDFEELVKYFPTLQTSHKQKVTGFFKEAGNTFFFYHEKVAASAHPEKCFLRMTSRLLQQIEQHGQIPSSSVCSWLAAEEKFEEIFEYTEEYIFVPGIPDEVFKQNYLLVVRLLRLAANYNLKIEANTWIAVVRAARRVLDYVPVSDIINEWRNVDAEHMWRFAQMLFDSQLMHGFIPEVAALSRVKHIKTPEAGEENVFEHSIEVMRRYVEELPYDWYGAVACLFHDVGKLYTAEYDEKHWTFYQHHRVGAHITRKILKRLNFPQEDSDLICQLVNNHMYLHFMLTDRGIRRFIALDDYPRIIEMVRADIKARDGSYRELNHNLKMLERTEVSEEAIEPMLNGNEIMQITGLKPGRSIGILRDALIRAQIMGDVSTIEEAQKFAKNYAQLL